MLKCFFRLLRKYLSSDIEEAVERAFSKAFSFAKENRRINLNNLLQKGIK